MWVVASNTRVKKALHHISINPYKDERLTDAQVLKIVERCEQAYGYKLFRHQRVIVEHIKDGRQHFHVMWNRVSLQTGRAVWPGEHWKKSKQVCREMERELGLKRPTPRRNNKSGTTKTRITTTRTTVTRTTIRHGGTTGIKSGNVYGAKSLLPRPKVSRPNKPTSAQQAPVRPVFMRPNAKKGWPPEAVKDWAAWGHRNPGRFFAVWPELSI